jgi:hypothetical protein
MPGVKLSLLSIPIKITTLGKQPLPNLLDINTISLEEKLYSIFLLLLSMEN